MRLELINTETICPIKEYVFIHSREGLRTVSKQWLGSKELGFYQVLQFHSSHPALRLEAKSPIPFPNIFPSG